MMVKNTVMLIKHLEKGQDWLLKAVTKTKTSNYSFHVCLHVLSSGALLHFNLAVL